MQDEVIARELLRRHFESAAALIALMLKNLADKVRTLMRRHRTAKVLLTCVWLCVSTSVGAEPACTPNEKAKNDAVTRKATKAWLKHTRGRIHSYEVNRSDCDDKVIIVFEGVGEDVNVGN